MTTDNDKRRHLRSDDLTWRQIDGQVVILDLRSGMYLTINKSGVPLWQRLAEGATSNELAAALEQKYQIESTRAQADADAFIGLLDERGLLS